MNFFAPVSVANTDAKALKEKVFKIMYNAFVQLEK